MRKLVLVGAGGFSREVAEAIRALNVSEDAEWDLRGYLDDDPAKHGSEVDGLPVLGTSEWVREHSDTLLLVATGRPSEYTSRFRVVERLQLPRSRYATVVHPAASLSRSTQLGVGSAVLAGVVATASVTIGDHVAIMPGVVLTHDDVIADFVNLTAGVRLGGGVHVETGAYVGSGTVVREGVRIGAWSMIGMGSVVTRDVPPGELWYGTPASSRREAPVPPEFLAERAGRD